MIGIINIINDLYYFKIENLEWNTVYFYYFIVLLLNKIFYLQVHF